MTWRACSIAWAISGANAFPPRRLRESTQTGMCSPSRARRSSLTNVSSLVAWEMNTGPLLMRPLFASPANHACWFVVSPG